MYSFLLIRKKNANPSYNTQSMVTMPAFRGLHPMTGSTTALSLQATLVTTYHSIKVAGRDKAVVEPVMGWSPRNAGIVTIDWGVFSNK